MLADSSLFLPPCKSFYRTSGQVRALAKKQSPSSGSASALELNPFVALLFFFLSLFTQQPGSGDAQMLPLSVRRAVASAPQGAGLTSLAASVPKVSASSFILNRPQRRLSSSKPSRSDEPNDIAAGQSVPASASARGESKAGRKRKTKDAADRNAAFKKLPSVPSTHHMSEEGERCVLPCFKVCF